MLARREGDLVAIPRDELIRQIENPYVIIDFNSEQVSKRIVPIHVLYSALLAPFAHSKVAEGDRPLVGKRDLARNLLGFVDEMIRVYFPLGELIGFDSDVIHRYRHTVFCNKALADIFA